MLSLQQLLPDGPRHKQAVVPADVMQHRVRSAQQVSVEHRQESFSRASSLQAPAVPLKQLLLCCCRLWSPVEGMRPFLLLCPDRKQFVVLLSRDPETKVQ